MGVWVCLFCGCVSVLWMCVCNVLCIEYMYGVCVEENLRTLYVFCGIYLCNVLYFNVASRITVNILTISANFFCL